MRRYWLPRLVAAGLFVSVVAAGIVLYRRSNPPLLSQMVRVCDLMPYDQCQVIGFPDRDVVLLRQTFPKRPLFAVNTRTNRRSDLTELNRRIRQFQRGDILIQSSMLAISLAPNNKWILFFVSNKDSRRRSWVAMAIDGSEFVTWPFAEAVKHGTNTWLPDSSGFRYMFERNGRFSVMTCLLNTPGKTHVRRMPPGYTRPGNYLATDGNISADMQNNAMTVYSFHPGHPELIRRRTEFRCHGMYPEGFESFHFNDRFNVATYITVGYPDQQNWLGRLADRWRLPRIVKDVLDNLVIRRALDTHYDIRLLDLSDGQEKLIGSYRGPCDYDSLPLPIGWLPNNQLGFLYRGGLYALPLPPEYAHGTRGR